MTFSKKVIYAIFGVLFAGSLGASFYFYRQYAALYQTLPQAAQEDAKKLVAEVGRLIILPANEQPTIATVADPDKLRDQPFFANAKKGDKVLIYANAKKAILYDPAEDKIVEVAPISISIGQEAPSASSTVVSAGQATSSPSSQSYDGQTGQAPASTTQSSSTIHKKK